MYKINLSCLVLEDGDFRKNGSRKPEAQKEAEECEVVLEHGRVVKDRMGFFLPNVIRHPRGAVARLLPRSEATAGGVTL